MTYVKCHDCEKMSHYRPNDVAEFHKRFVENNEPIYCIHCFKKREKHEVYDTRNNEVLFTGNKEQCSNYIDNKMSTEKADYLDYRLVSAKKNAR